MKRTEARALLLVNWKGVPYCRYELDPGVTALEGANGAGKTTVMIAAYVALMPDMTKLRFANLGEHERSGGDRGVFGRLGVRDVPSYTALDLRLATGERLVAAVQLERRAEPSVNLEPFLVHGLADDVALQSLFLDRRGLVESVPPLSRVKELVGLAGGRLEHCSSARDYFTALFDRGVTPLRLAVEEERGKFNDMLHTSMVGGISRMLGTGLRAFLFREESGLADTLRTMKKNLDECRSTRREVNESQRVEAELRGVYEPGRRVFAAALFATRQHAQELRNAMDAARRDHEAASARRQAREVELAEARSRAADAARKLASLDEDQRQARDRLDLVTRAHLLTKKLVLAQADAGAAESRFETARSRSGAADERLERARDAEAVAAQDRDRAAEGLGDAEKGVQELARRAGLHRRSIDAKASAERLLARAVDPADLPATLRTVETERDRLDSVLAAQDALLKQAEARRREFEVAHGALGRIRTTAVEESAAFDVAREALQRGRELEGLVADRARLERDRQRLGALAGRQDDARRHARRLSTATAPLHSAADVMAAHDEARAAIDEHRRRGDAARLRVDELEREAKACEGQAVALEPARDRWRTARDLADQLGTAQGVTLSDASGVEALRARLENERDDVRRELASDEAMLASIAQALHALEHGGSRDPLLQSVAERLGGEWLSDRFDDVELEDAPKLEARLGPLRDALVVESPEAAATALAQGATLPASVWLLDADASARLHQLPESFTNGHVVVRSDEAWRVTPLPERPLLGRRARLRRIEEFRGRQKDLGDRLVALRGRQRQVDLARAMAQQLHELRAELERPDPGVELARLRSDATKSRAEANVVRGTLAGLAAQERSAKEREAELLTLRGKASLLDEPDAAEELALLDRRLEELNRAERELARTRADLELLAARLEALREVPLSPAERARIQGEIEANREDRARLFLAHGHLGELDRHREALGWTEAEAALEAVKALAPGLRAALDQAKAALDRATHARAAADTDARALRSELIEAEALWRQRHAEVESLGTELTGLGVADASEAAVGEARTRVDHAAGLTNEARQEHARLSNDEGRRESVMDQAAKDEFARAQVLQTKEAAARPAQERWDRLELAAREARVYDEALTEAGLPEGNAINLWQSRTTPRAELLERLRKLKDGADLADRLSDRLSPSGEEPQGLLYLDAWLELRGWLARRVPAQISEGDDPVRALTVLGERLAQLSDRLSVQEHQLRGEATSVAASIRAASQKAGTTVKKLNQDLRDVSFGSITSVRLLCERNAQMDQVLRALGGEAGQSLLFSSDLPFEDALNKLFEDYGGGKSAGQRLLDYREYLDLRVEVTRRGSSTWELANPTRMSTGEAIGVGAAVMIVVLGAWERDAQFIRGKRASASLRFLFLDEASRLDKDTLGNLFELCSRLGLQLLIAAPEVARAEKNTTYRLVRRVDGEGREGVDVVLVSGRRRHAVPDA